MPVWVTTPSTRSPVDDQIVDSLLENTEIGLVFENRANRGFVQHAIGLRTRGAHRRALAGVEHAKLNAAAIGRGRHGAAERIDFFDQMAFADAADGRIARHLAQRFDVVT